MRRLSKMQQLNVAIRHRNFYVEKEEEFFNALCEASERGEDWKFRGLNDMREKCCRHIIEESDRIYELIWGFDKVVYEASAVL